MLKEKERVVVQAKILFDMIAIVVSFFGAYFLSVKFHDLYTLDLFSSINVVGVQTSLSENLPMLIFWVLLWLLMLSMNGAYKSFRVFTFFELVRVIVRAAFFSALGFGALCFLLRMQFVGRIFFVIYVSLAAIALILEKWAIALIAKEVRRRGHSIYHVLIVGTGQRAGKFIKILKSHPEWGLKIIGLIDDDESLVGKTFHGEKVIGDLNSMPRLLEEKVIDNVIFIVPRKWLDRIQETIALCELQGVKTSISADLFDLKIAHARQMDVEGIPLISFDTTPAEEWELFVKRTIDVVASAIGLVVLLPLFLIVAVLIKLTSPGPLFFMQKRVTLNNRKFVLYKFRSMDNGAEKKREALSKLNEIKGPVFKIKDDPRITPLGKFLRKTSIDELPQLFNILMGDMSIVGPRALFVKEVAKFELWQRRRQSMRSGLTCLWAIRGRSNINFEDWMELDLEYIDNWSLWLDLEVLIKTVPVVLFGIGAH